MKVRLSAFPATLTTRMCRRVYGEGWPSSKLRASLSVLGVDLSSVLLLLGLYQYI